MELEVIVVVVVVVVVVVLVLIVAVDVGLVVVVVLKYLTFIYKFTISPVTLAAPLLTVFNAKFIVSVSIAGRC